MDATEKLIRDFMYKEYPQKHFYFLEDWIKSKDGNILEVFVEFLEVYKKTAYLSKREEQLMEDYRYLSTANKTKFSKFLNKLLKEEDATRQLEKAKQKENTD